MAVAIAPDVQKEKLYSVIRDYIESPNYISPRQGAQTLMAEYGPSLWELIEPDVESMLTQMFRHVAATGRRNALVAMREGTKTLVGESTIRSALAGNIWDQFWTEVGKKTSDLTREDLETISENRRATANAHIEIADWAERVLALTKTKRVQTVGELRLKGVDLPEI